MTRQPGPAGRHAFSLIVFALAALLGLAALAYPFSAASLGQGAGRAADAPLVVAGLLTLCVLGMLAEAQSGSLNARGIALKVSTLSAPPAAMSPMSVHVST